MSKKNPKSMFAWCIRTLAVSLVPTLLLVSCASDSDSKKEPADTTAPTLTSTLGTKAITGTSDMVVTFSEAVEGVTGNAVDGACDATKTVKLTDASGSCYGMVIVATDETYTINPVSDLVSGSYSLTLGTGITDAAGNALSETTISFTVNDALTTVIANLTANLAGIDEGAAIAAAAKTSASATGVTNNLLNVIPAAFEGALDYMNDSDTIEYATALTAVI